MQHMIELAIEKKNLDKIKCVECALPLEGKDVREFVSSEIYKSCAFHPKCLLYIRLTSL